MSTRRLKGPDLPPRPLAEDDLFELARGAHVSWVVADDERYLDVARSLIAQGTAAGEKVFAFGPAGSAMLEALGGDTHTATDPLVAFLDGRFDPDTMFDAFREQTSIARSEGFGGLCVVADMDWVLGARPSAVDVLQFELLLDRVVHELEATVVCAYRATSFDPHTLVAVQAVHPFPCGDPKPQFQLFDDTEGAWRLTGEVDLAVEEHFAAALGAIAGEDSVIDVTGLKFIDVGGIRALARASARGSIRVRGARESLRRFWKLGSFDRIAPLAEAG